MKAKLAILALITTGSFGIIAESTPPALSIQDVKLVEENFTSEKESGPKVNWVGFHRERRWEGGGGGWGERRWEGHRRERRWEGGGGGWGERRERHHRHHHH